MKLKEILPIFRKFIMDDMGSIFLKNIILDGKNVDISIDSGRFRSIVPSGTSAAGAASGVEVLDCCGLVAVPGLVNMHTHAAMALMRGVGEDMDFRHWIDRIWNIEEKIDAEYVYWATKVACIEMIKTGTTTVNDQYWFPMHGHRAASEMGLRSVVSYVVCDKNNPQEAAREREQLQEMYEESLRWPAHTQFAAAFHAIYSVSEEMIVWVHDFAVKHSLKLHFHLAETENEVVECRRAHGGMTPVEYLDSLGVLDSDSIAAHTLWLSENDIRILGERRVNCVHNVNSNLKLSSGYKFKYNELRDSGANICIGTDGCASSNNLDMLEAMKTSAILQKAWRRDPAAMPLDELMATATVNGGRALGLDVGRIEEGALADMLIVDTDSPFFLSPGPFLGNFIYSAHSDCIKSVICNGRFIMKDRVVPGEKEILEKARSVLGKLS